MLIVSQADGVITVYLPCNLFVRMRLTIILTNSDEKAYKNIVTLIKHIADILVGKNIRIKYCHAYFEKRNIF